MIKSLQLPPGYKYRELWLPQNIIPDTSLLRSVHAGHNLTLTGAKLSSTVDGLKMQGAELVTITDHADIHITDNLTVVLPAFILPVTFAAGAVADMGIMNLNNGAVIARLNSTTGALDFIFNDVDGGADETVSTTKVSWAKDTLWQVGFTFVNNGTGVISVIIYINGVAENTNDQVDGPIVVPAGNTILGNDLTTFITGKLQRQFLVYSTTILTATRMLNIYKGEIYATNLKAYLPFDHPGRALSMPDRSTGGNCSGTISGTATASIWDFGTIKQSALDVDGLNDYAQSALAVIDTSGDLSMVWVGKIRTSYDALTGSPFLFTLRTAVGQIMTMEYNQPTNEFRFFYRFMPGPVDRIVTYTPKPSIDDYVVIICKLTAAGVISLFGNGVLMGTTTGGGSALGLGQITVGAHPGLSNYGHNKPLLIALISGAFTKKDAIAYARYLKNKFNLPISV